MLTDVYLFLILLISYVNYSTGVKSTLNLTILTLESVGRLDKTLNFLGIKTWLSVRQADALTVGQTMLTHVFLFLILIISYVNYSTGLKPPQTLI